MGHNKHKKNKRRGCDACGCNTACVQTIAAAQITDNAFRSNAGFRTLNHSAVGVYQLTLCRCYNPCRFVVSATLNSDAPGDITVQLQSGDSSDTITILTFNGVNPQAPEDGDFFVEAKLLGRRDCVGCDDPDDEDEEDEGDED